MEKFISPKQRTIDYRPGVRIEKETKLAKGGFTGEAENNILPFKLGGIKPEFKSTSVSAIDRLNLLKARAEVIASADKEVGHQKIGDAYRKIAEGTPTPPAYNLAQEQDRASRVIQDISNDVLLHPFRQFGDLFQLAVEHLDYFENKVNKLYTDLYHNLLRNPQGKLMATNSPELFVSQIIKFINYEIQTAKKEIKSVKQLENFINFHLPQRILTKYMDGNVDALRGVNRAIAAFNRELEDLFNLPGAALGLLATQEAAASPVNYPFN